jgi:hypothetical protein
MFEQSNSELRNHEPGPSLDSVLSTAERFATVPARLRAAQSWRWRRDANSLTMLVDDESGGIAPADTLLACGAALQNARIAIRNSGREPVVEIFPDAGATGRLACVRLGGSLSPSAEDEALFAILRGQLLLRGPARRHGPMSPALVALLRHAVRSHSVWLEIVTDAAQRARLCDLITRAATKPARHALDSGLPWVVPSRTEDPRPDSSLASILNGLGASVHGLNGNCRPAEWLGLPVGDPPVLAVLGTVACAPADLLIAGESLQRLLLHAAVQGLRPALMRLSQDDGVARELSALFVRQGEPQIVLRIGLERSGVSLGAFRSLGPRLY